MDAPAWKAWTGLSIVYLAWGATYPSMRVMVETVPPLLGSGLRFVVAGAVMLAFVGRRCRPSRRQFAGAFLVGLLLPGANAMVTTAEQEVPANIAALLIASVPLWVLLLRRAIGERVSAAGLGAVLVGFAGVAILMQPGEQSAGASVLALLAVVGAAIMWASGSVASTRLDLPPDPLVSTAWAMLLGGLTITATGFAIGESVATPSVRSALGFAYLVVIGSIIAYTAYAWLLRNVPLQRVATYAYVNPVIAIALSALLLDEAITSVTLAGAALIIVSVALVVRTTTPRTAARTASTARSASASA
jgi:drug/metabolite transporter (DMT)-like permease